MKGLIVDHQTRFIKQLKALFKGCDVVSYLEFDPVHAGGYDYVILSGGPIHISYATDLSEEKKFLRQTDKPILGICLGLEILGIAYGSTIRELPKKRTGLHTVNFLDQEMKIFQSHRFCLATLPKDFIALATTGTIIEIIKHKYKPLLAFQGHPELSGRYGKIIKKHFLNDYCQLM